MKRMLQIAPGLSLPIDYVTKATAIFAQRRKGKTYTASVIAEELVDHDLPWVALDPTGAWWGLRALADAKGEGLPVTIFGGQHGDSPLSRDDGKVIGNLVVDHPGWYILDLSLFESKAAERDFAAEFAETLYRRKGQPDSDFPLHLFVDEADMFVPQDRESGDQKMLGAFQSIVRRGGLRGLGTTLISQRPALVNKSVLVQLDLLVLLRLVAGNDQDYVKKNYLERAGTKEQVDELMASWAGLKLGEAWLWEPGAEPPLFVRAQIRERRTFNSSATPKVGEKRVEPKRLAAVDLDAVKEAMAAAIARAEADDPKALRARIRELEKELRTSHNEAPAAAPPVVEYVDVPAISDEQLAALTGCIEDLRLTSSSLAADTLTFSRTVDELASALETVGARPRDIVVQPAPQSRTRQQPLQEVQEVQEVVATNVDAPIKAGAKRMLVVLARYGRALTRDQLSTLAHVAKGGTLSEYTRSIVDAGLAAESSDGVRLTNAGLQLVSDAQHRGPMDVAEIVAMYAGDLKAGAKRMLDLLVSDYPEGLTRHELSEQAEVAKGGTLSEYTRSLLKRGLAVEGGGVVRANPTLFMR